jgi:hypothetical protein
MDGPLGSRAKSQVEVEEKDRVVTLISRLEYMVPPIVPVSEYASWKAFLERLAKAGQERVRVAWPVESESQP